MTKQIDPWCPRCHKYPLVQEIGMCWTCYGRELRVTEESKMKSEIELEIEKEFDLNEMNRLVAKKKPINRTHYQKWAKWQEVWLKNHIKNGKPICEWSKLEQDLGVSEEKIKSKIKAMGITLEPDRPILTSKDLDEAKNKGVNSGYAGMDKAEVDANFDKALEIDTNEKKILVHVEEDSVKNDEYEEMKRKWEKSKYDNEVLQRRMKTLTEELGMSLKYRTIDSSVMKSGFVKIIQEDVKLEDKILKLFNDKEAPDTFIVNVIEGNNIIPYLLNFTVGPIESRAYKKYIEQGTELIYYKK